MNLSPLGLERPRLMSFPVQCQHWELIASPGNTEYSQVSTNSFPNHTKAYRHYPMKILQCLIRQRQTKSLLKNKNIPMNFPNTGVISSPSYSGA